MALWPPRDSSPCVRGGWNWGSEHGMAQPGHLYINSETKVYVLHTCTPFLSESLPVSLSPWSSLNVCPVQLTLIWQQSQLLFFTTDDYKYAVKGKLCFVRTLISSFKFFLWLFALSNWCPAKLDWHFSSTGFEFRLVGFWLLASWVCCSKLLLTVYLLWLPFH